MDAQGALIGLTIFGLVVGFAGGLISQLKQTSIDNADGGRVLTAAGRLALGVAIVGFVGSFASILLNIKIDADAKAASAKLTADAKVTSAKRAADAQARREQESAWRDQSNALSAKIYAQTQAQLDQTSANMRRTLEEFHREQLASIATDKAIAVSSQRIMSPLGEPSLDIMLALECSSPEFSAWCGKVNAGGSSRVIGAADWATWPRGPVARLTTVVCLFHSRQQAVKSLAGGRFWLDCNTTFPVQASSAPTAGTENAPGFVALSALAAPATKAAFLSVQNFKADAKFSRSDNVVSSIFDLVGGELIYYSYGSDLNNVTLNNIILSNALGQRLTINGDACRKINVVLPRKVLTPSGYVDSPERGSGFDCKVPTVLGAP